MLSLITIVFVLGYAAIVFEHPIKVNKTASALLTGVLCWSIYVFSGINDTSLIAESLNHHLAGVAEILFFLLGAMTIVELVDAHHGFKVITERITTRSVIKLMWIISIITFFLSSVLDNLTTAIVMVSLLRKILPSGDMRKLFVGMVIIAANSGGAWSPIGDVTTTMLWIGGQVTTTNIIATLFIPSLVSLVIPLVFLTYTIRNEALLSARNKKENEPTPDGSKVMFILGLSSLLFVPIFKTVTHLPPYMGILFGLAVVWIASEIIHKDKDEEVRKPYTAAQALSRIDSSSVLFFLGILISIGCLESTGILNGLAKWMDEKIGNLELIATVIGLFSAIVDNVPLVAACIGMYPLETFPADHKLWEMLAYCAGTGGSILIIGSASGVAAMGMEKIDFIWYLKRISLLALLGYIGGTIAYLLVYSLLNPMI